MVLVDTSVWIEVFRKPSRLQLDSVIELDEIVTCLPVIQEVLRGEPPAEKGRGGTP